MSMLVFATAGEELSRGDLVWIDPVDGLLKKAHAPPWQDERTFYLPYFAASGVTITFPDRSGLMPDSTSI